MTICVTPEIEIKIVRGYWRVIRRDSPCQQRADLVGASGLSADGGGSLLGAGALIIAGLRDAAFVKDERGIVFRISRRRQNRSWSSPRRFGRVRYPWPPPRRPDR